MAGLKLGIGGKIWALVGLIVVGLALLAIQGLISTRQTMIEDRRQALRQVIESAESIVASFQARVTRGEMTDETAKAAAIATLRVWRYGKNDYVFINNFQFTSVMHPLRPEMEGMDQREMKDPDGTYVTRAMVETAERDGKGFVNYRWARAKDAPPSPKLVYVSTFKPWNWIIGTGVYMDDIDEAFRAQVIDVIIKALGILAVTAAIGVLIARSITGPLGILIRRMRALAEGDTSQNIIGTTRHDELGELARAMEIFRSNSMENKRLLEEQEAMKQTTTWPPCPTAPEPRAT